MDQQQNLLRKLIDAILVEGIHQIARGHLYTALLNYLQYTHMLASSFEIRVEDRAILQQAIESTLASYGMSLLSRIGHDALHLDAKNIWKAVSFALLDDLFQYDVEKKFWIVHLEKSGFLAQLFDTLMNQEKSLQMEENASEREKIVYIFESIISVLVRVAQSMEGCKLLEKFELLPKLTKSFALIDAQPSQLLSNQVDQFDTLHHQLFIPILRLVVTMFDTLRDNKKVAGQVIAFIVTHHKIISGVFKHALRKMPNYAILEEMKLITSMFYLLSGHKEELKKVCSMFTQCL